jgi:hypothetical protein
MNSASLCSLAGRYDNPIPTRSLAPIDCLKIPALYHPPPPISFCEGPRIIQKLKDVVVQILELPLYLSILFATKGDKYTQRVSQ